MKTVTQNVIVAVYLFVLREKLSTAFSSAIVRIEHGEVGVIRIFVSRELKKGIYHLCNCESCEDAKEESRHKWQADREYVGNPYYQYDEGPFGSY